MSARNHIIEYMDTCCPDTEKSRGWLNEVEALARVEARADMMRELLKLPSTHPFTATIQAFQAALKESK